MSSLNPRDPFVLDVRDLRGAGSMAHVERTVPAPGDLGAGVAMVPAGSEIMLSLRLEAVVEGVLISGTVAVGIVGECARCLDPIAWDEKVALSELYVHQREPGEEDLPLIEGDLINLEPAVRDAVVLALPLAPLCQPDCPGLCVQCGARLDPTHTHNRIDPRWAELAGFDERLKKED